MDYNRFLQLEAQLTKYKFLCAEKLNEIKRLKDQIARYKRKESKLSDVEPEQENSMMFADETNVKRKILI